MEFRVLGPLEVGRGGDVVLIGSRMERAVLTALLVSANAAVSTARLIEVLWGDDPPPSDRNSLQTHVARLRRRLGGPLADTPIVSRPPGYLIASIPPVSTPCASRRSSGRHAACGRRIPPGRSACSTRRWRCGGGRPSPSSLTRTWPGPRPSASRSSGRRPLTSESRPSSPWAGSPRRSGSSRPRSRSARCGSGLTPSSWTPWHARAARWKRCACTSGTGTAWPTRSDWSPRRDAGPGGPHPPPDPGAGPAPVTHSWPPRQPAGAGDEPRGPGAGGGRAAGRARASPGGDVGGTGRGGQDPPGRQGGR